MVRWTRELAAGGRAVEVEPELLEWAEFRVLDIPEPRRAVLDEAARQACCIEVQLRP